MSIIDLGPLWVPSQDPDPSGVEAHRKSRRTCGAIGDRCKFARTSSMFPAGVQGRSVVECAMHTHQMTPYHAPHPRQVFAADVCSTWTPDTRWACDPEPDYEAIEAARIAGLPEYYR